MQRADDFESPVGREPIAVASYPTSFVHRFVDDTPPWHDIGQAQDPNGPAGKHLGSLGKRIAVECFVTFVEASSISIYHTELRPRAGAFGCQNDGEDTLAHLIRYATGQ